MTRAVHQALAAMEQALRRLDAALAQRALGMRMLAEQHGEVTAELKRLRQELDAAKREAEDNRERAAFVDALRAELAEMQHERAELEAKLAEALSRVPEKEVPAPAAMPVPPVPVPDENAAAEIAALKAELTAARALEKRLSDRLEILAQRIRAALAAKPAA